MIIENEAYILPLYMRNLNKNKVQSINLTGNGLVKVIGS